MLVVADDGGGGNKLFYFRFDADLNDKIPIRWILDESE